MIDDFATDKLTREDPATAGGHRAKKPYTTPRLKTYGGIREITQTSAAGPPRNADGPPEGFNQKRTNGAA